MVGLVTAKALAHAAGKPLIAVNHLEGHALSPRLVEPDLAFPYLLLLVSGGHCQLLVVAGVGRYRRLATTVDDAVGEAFDKAAKLLGLGYPGGPALERLAADGDPAAVPLPRPLVGSAEPHFSFAGLKSAVARAVQSGEHRPADIAASFQAAAVDCLARPHGAGAGGGGAGHRAGGGGRRGGQRAGVRAADGAGGGTRLALRGPARLAVHGQRGHDRLGRLRAAGARPDRRAGGGGATEVAAGPGRRAGQGRGGEGVRGHPHSSPSSLGEGDRDAQRRGGGVVVRGFPGLDSLATPSPATSLHHPSTTGVPPVVPLPIMRWGGRVCAPAYTPDPQP